MKADLIPIACSAAMAIMVGAAASHFATVRQMVDLAQLEASPLAPLSSPSSEPAESGELLDLIAHLQEQNHLLRANIRSASQGTPHADAETAPLLTTADASPRDLQRLLSEIIAQNRELQTKLAETNRDVMALEFRVDSHSEQFRPLNLEYGTDYPVASPITSPDVLDDMRNDIGVLPPLDESDYTQ